MVCSCMWKELISTVYPEGYVDGGSKWRTGTRETEVRLDGWCEGGLGQHRNDGGGCTQCSKYPEEWRALVHI